MVKEQLYKKFAKYYDKIYSKKEYSKEVNFIDSILKKHNLKGKKILDIACGTGTHAKLLKEKGYSVTGIDINPGMLKIARKKAKGIKFIRGDMKKLELKEKFDAIICMFTSINYNTTLKELKKALSNFYKILNKGGIVIFDLGLTKEGKRAGKQKDYCTYIDTYSETDLQIARISQWQPSKENKNIFNANFLMLVKDKGKIDFEIDEHKLGVFNPEEITKIMKSIGFKVSVYDNFSLKKYTKKSKRAVFVGTK